jgi:hypothetical protein
MYETPVLFGRHFDHFANEAAALSSACPETIVADFAELAARLRSWLDEPALRHRASSLQKAALPDPGQIGARYSAILTPSLHRQGVLSKRHEQ